MAGGAGLSTSMSSSSRLFEVSSTVEDGEFVEAADVPWAGIPPPVYLSRVCWGAIYLFLVYLPSIFYAWPAGFAPEHLLNGR